VRGKERSRKKRWKGGKRQNKKRKEKKKCDR
jgi:hypothetical protein